MRLDTARTLAINASKPSRLAWAVFIRTTFIPASNNSFIKSTSQRLSEMEATILVCFSNIIYLPIYIYTYLSNKASSARRYEFNPNPQITPLQAQAIIDTWRNCSRA